MELLSLGSDLEVKSPESLIKAMKRNLKATLKYYQGRM